MHMHKPVEQKNTMSDRHLSSPNVCVFLLQLGGPSDLAEIRPFLQQLFEDVLPGPSLFRKILSRLIAWRRTPKVRPLYEAIGGGSPLLPNTNAQAQALSNVLTSHGLTNITLVAMRYAPPRLHQALESAKELHPNVPWVILPLYPHYSYATTRSSLVELNAHIEDSDRARLHVIKDYATHPKFIAAYADLLNRAIQQAKTASSYPVHVVFSAHGLPLSFVRNGDPYPKRVQSCVQRLVEASNLTCPWTLAYQSRVGPVKWLSPSTSDTLAQLGHQGVKNVVVLPISFVSEHIETLQELDIELKEEAQKAGITNYTRVPTVGTHPLFIDALSDLVRKSLKDPTTDLNLLQNP